MEGLEREMKSTALAVEGSHSKTHTKAIAGDEVATIEVCQSKDEGLPLSYQWIGTTRPMAGGSVEDVTKRINPFTDRRFREQFVELYSEGLHNKSHGLCCGLAIEDYSNEAVNEAFRKLRESAKLRSFCLREARRYASRVLRNVCLDERRRRQRLRYESSLSGNDPASKTMDRFTSGTDDPEALLSKRIEQLAVLYGFGYLSRYVNDREIRKPLDVLWLREVEDLSCSEVAAEYDVKPSLIARWTSRGKQALCGWVHGLSEACPARVNGDRKYWVAGFDASLDFEEEHPGWWCDPTAAF